MKKLLALILLSMLCSVVFAQQKADAEVLVKAGIDFHKIGNYEEAIIKYDEALKLDSNNLFALSEKSITLFTLKKYSDCIDNCLQAIKYHPKEDDLKDIFVICGNAYDESGKTKKAIEIFDEGIAMFPDFFLLYFNKGVSLTSIKKYDEAVLCFQKSMIYNPSHSSSHNAIARVLDMKGEIIPALLAYLRFLVIEPQGNRAVANITGMQRLMKSTTKQNDDNAISLNINTDMMGDTIQTDKKKENDFTSIETLLSESNNLLSVKKNRKKSEVERFLLQFDLVCSSLAEQQNSNHGFYWNYYAPYFIEMEKRNFTLTFGYIALSGTNSKEIDKWIKKHKKEIDAFYQWSNEFKWDSFKSSEH